MTSREDELWNVADKVAKYLVEKRGVTTLLRYPDDKGLLTEALNEVGDKVGEDELFSLMGMVNPLICRYAKRA